MGLRRSIFNMYQLILSSIQHSRNRRLIIIGIFSYFCIFITIQRKLTLSTSTFCSEKYYSEHQLTPIEKHNKTIIVNKQFSFLLLNETNNKNSSNQSNLLKSHEAHMRYSFIDIDYLNVDIDSLNETSNSSFEYPIDLPSSTSHRYSRILNVKGDSSLIFYNELPQSYEFTMGLLLDNLSYIHSYRYVSSQILTPYIYNESSLIAIGQSVIKHKFNKLFYKRQIYFFDFYSLKFVTHPVWISLIRDPISRIAAEFEYSREICQKTKNCLLTKHQFNETLDQCVTKNSAEECISSAYGISRMLPFFCGLTDPNKCQEENKWTLKQAKRNIDFFYTVIGLTEQLYKFLYVLEKLLPDYFKLARLILMNQQNPVELVDQRDIHFQIPNIFTINLIKPFLEYEYDLYDYIQQRFSKQYEILTALDN